MPFLKKRHAGSDSFGHVWETDGATVEVTDDEAYELLRVHDSGFEAVDAPDDTKTRKTDK